MPLGRSRKKEDPHYPEKEKIGGGELRRPPWYTRMGGVIYTLVSLACVGTALYMFFLAPEGGKSAKERLAGQPKVLVWSWESPDDLRFIDTKKTGVAFLAATLHMAGERIETRARLQAMKLPENAYRIAVFHIESDARRPPVLNRVMAVALAQQVIIVLGNQKVQGVQIDFDAQEDQREFYAEFLTKVREMISDDMMLSMTSLASWCLKDTWPTKMPCEEIVPMFFSMGSAREEAVAELSAGRLAKMPMQLSLGLAVDEPDVLKATKVLPEHVYVFSTHGWNSNASHEFLSQILSQSN